MIKAISLFILAFSFTTAHASDFSPSRLTLSAPSMSDINIPLNIPVMVSGTPATVIFSVFTSDNGSSVNAVRNGFLGWHYVNHIDTCVYVSQSYQFNPGKNTIMWDGKNQDGVIVVVSWGEYTYYLFGYDNKSPKIPAALHMPFMWDDTSIIVTRNSEGAPIARPIIYSGANEWKTQQDPWERIRSRWTIGGDPDDASLVETTLYSGWNEHCQVAPDPQNDSMFFITTIDNTLIGHLRKYRWVSGGEAVMQHDWGDDGQFLWEVHASPGDWCAHQPLRSFDNDFLITTDTDFRGVSDTAELVIVDSGDGDELNRIDLSDWWIRPQDSETGGQKSGGPTDMDVMHGKLLLGSHTSCLNQVIDPLNESGEYTLWVNGNGDYVGDKNDAGDHLRSWVCNDYEQAPFKHTVSFDDYLFSVFPADGLGSSSFGLFAPDGTGIGYFAFANETTGAKYGQYIVDIGSPYDGIYCDNTSIDTQTGGWWYVAHDTFRGVIGFGIVDHVEEEDRSPAFSVDGNYPNPFNTGTTIRFTLTDAAETKVEVFNMAGQKVNTIVDGFLDAGVHSVSWNAVTHAAGVYICRVKSGRYSGMIKMSYVR